MTLSVEAADVLSEPLVRSDIYRAFARSFKYPTLEAYETYQSGQFVWALLGCMSELPHLSDMAFEEAGMAGRTSEDLRAWTFEDFETTYVGTFDVGFPEPPCPPYEGLYSDALPRTEIMLEVGGFYAHFGLAMSQEEGKRELPDYLCAELEFMSFLALKEAQACESSGGSAQELRRGYRLAQKDFLERHLVGWLPKFLRKLQGLEGQVFYPDLARVLVRFVNEDFALLAAAVA
jgi:DMSO reductase family type II enzyme chaperone